MKNIVATAVAAILILSSCGKALEDREAMDRNAKRTADSLKRALDSCLLDPAKTISEGVAPVVTTTASAPTATPANGGH